MRVKYPRTPHLPWSRGNTSTAASLYIEKCLEYTADDLCCTVEDIVKDFRIDCHFNYMDDCIIHIHFKLYTSDGNHWYSVQDTLFINHHTIANDTIKIPYKEEPSSITLLLDKISQLIEPRVTELKELNADKIEAKEKADWDAAITKRLQTYVKPSIYRSK